jgi:phosphate transport system substrate-binding protein
MQVKLGQLGYNLPSMLRSGDTLIRRWRLAAAWLLLAVLATACGSTAAAGTSANAQPLAEGAGASIQNIGSDTMVNLALAWAEAYAGQHPDVRISVTGGGSGTGLAALVNGTVDIANASRAINKDETAKATANGINPTEFVVARDAIAVIVNPANPVSHLSLPQLSKIYTGQITNWREVGGEDRPIVLLSRETNSGTHVYFLENVVRLGKKGDKTLFSPDTLLMPSSEGISAEVRQNPNAIGYDGLGYVTPDMKTVAVGRADEGPFIMPSIATVNDKTYPIARDLFMYTRGAPAGAVKDYVDWIMAAEAQKVVAELGFVPIGK